MSGDLLRVITGHNVTDVPAPAPITNHWKTLCVVLATVCVCLATLPIERKPSGRFTDLNCTSLTLRDPETGGYRARLGFEPNGTAQLVFLDRGGKIRAAMATKTDGTPLFHLYDRDDHIRLFASLNPDGTSVLSVRGPDEQSGVSLMANDGGTSSATWCGVGNYPGMTITVLPDGKTNIARLKDSDAANPESHP